MALDFPPEIGHPDPSGYKITIADVTVRSTMGSGYVRARRMAQNGPSGLEVSWTLSNDLVQVFDNFYTRGLNQGADACIMPVWVYGSFHNQRVLFQGPPTFTYVAYDRWNVSAKFTIMDDRGPTIWREINSVDDGDVVLNIGELTDPWRVFRVDIHVLVPPNSGTSDVLRVGILSGDGEALVTDVDVSAHGSIYVKPGHANAGSGLNDLVAADNTITVKWNPTGTAPTQCHIVVVVSYRKT